MATLADIVIDCQHPASLARFWASVLDDYDVAPYDDEEMTRLATLGITDVDDDPTVLLEASAGPRIWFQQVPEPKSGKNRMHVDVCAVDRRAEVECLIALGATLIDEPAGQALTVMTDPEGNEFCLVD